MRGKIIHDIVDLLLFRTSRYMAPEDSQESLSLMISMAFCIDFAVTMVEECQHIHRAVADVFKLLQAFLHRVGLQVRQQSFEDLNARALVEEKEVLRWIHEQIHQMFHLGERSLDQ